MATNLEIRIDYALANGIFTESEIISQLKSSLAKEGKEEIDLRTFNGWKAAGFSVKRGQHSQYKVHQSGNNAETGDFYHFKAACFTRDQVEPTAEREARNSQKAESEPTKAQELLAKVSKAEVKTEPKTTRKTENKKAKKTEVKKETKKAEVGKMSEKARKRYDAIKTVPVKTRKEEKVEVKTEPKKAEVKKTEVKKAEPTKAQELLAKLAGKKAEPKKTEVKTVKETPKEEKKTIRMTRAIENGLSFIRISELTNGTVTNVIDIRDDYYKTMPAKAQKQFKKTWGIA